MIAEGPSANLPPHILLPDWAPEPVLPFSRLLTVAVLGLAVMAGACDRQGSEKAQPQAEKSASGLPHGKIDRSHQGSRLPDFTLADPAGRSLRLAEQTGRPLIVNLWATWCAPCVAELPQLDALAREGRFRVITISQDMTRPEKVAGFLRQRGGESLEPWLDPANDLSFHYRTGTLPTTIRYDAQGREVWRYVGGLDWTGAEAKAMLAEAGG